jgi:hypothetical protein
VCRGAFESDRCSVDDCLVGTIHGCRWVLVDDDTIYLLAHCSLMTFISLA